MRALDGVLAVNVPPPPSDRLWYGFRGVPAVSVQAVPHVGGRAVRQAIICKLIEVKLRSQLERILVLPNMLNIVLPYTDHRSV